MPWYIPLLIFIARVADVSIGTVRTVFVISGFRAASVVLGFVEVVVWVYAAGGAFKYLSNPLAVLGYAGGYAAGVYVGMWIEDKIAVGYRSVQIMNRDESIDLSTELRKRGWRVTRIEGHGMMGPVEIVNCVVRRRNLPKLRNLVAEAAPTAFLTVHRVERAENHDDFVEKTSTRFARRFTERIFPLRK